MHSRELHRDGWRVATFSSLWSQRALLKLPLFAHAETSVSFNWPTFLSKLSTSAVFFPGKSFHDDTARPGQNYVNLWLLLCPNRFCPLTADLESFSGTSLSRSAHILDAFARHDRHVFLMWWKSRKENASPTPLFQKSKEEKNPPSMLLHSGAPRISPNCGNIWTMLSKWLREIKSMSHSVIEYLIYIQMPCVQSPNFTLLFESSFRLLDLNQLSQTGLYVFKIISR